MGKNKIFFALILASILIFSMGLASAGFFDFVKNIFGGGKITGNPIGEIPVRDPILHYSMQDTNNVQIDLTGHNNSGQISGAVSSISSGIDGKSLSFNEGYITTPHSNSLNINGEFTLSAWVYIPSVESCSPSGNFPSIVGKLSSDMSGYGLLATRYTNASQCSVVASIGNPAKAGSWFGWYMTDWKIPAEIGSWHQYVATYNGSNLNLFVDGQLKSSVLSAPPATNYKPLYINKHFSDDTKNSIIIDEVMVYPLSFKGYEISRLYDEQKSRMESKNQSTTCFDSDGGTDYYVSGYVDENGHHNSDSCEGNFSVVEVNCRPGGGFEILQPYVCPNGCSDGACISNPDYAVLSAPFYALSNGIYQDYISLDIKNSGADNLFIQSVNISRCGISYPGVNLESGKNLTFVVNCIPDLILNTSFHGEIVINYKKESSSLNLTAFGSISGKVKNVPQSTCLDSDGGINNFTIYSNVKLGNDSYVDYCKSPFILSEARCEANNVLYENYECPFICSYGACKPGNYSSNTSEVPGIYFEINGGDVIVAKLRLADGEGEIPVAFGDGEKFLGNGKDDDDMIALPNGNERELIFNEIIHDYFVVSTLTDSYILRANIEDFEINEFEVVIENLITGEQVCIARIGESCHIGEASILIENINENEVTIRNPTVYGNMFNHIVSEDGIIWNIEWIEKINSSNLYRIIIYDNNYKGSFAISEYNFNWIDGELVMGCTGDLCYSSPVVNQVCSDLIDTVENPTDLSLNGWEWSLVHNDTSRLTIDINNQEEEFTSYYALWSYYNGSSYHIDKNVWVFDNRSINLSKYMSEIVSSSSFSCEGDIVDGQLVYVCGFGYNENNYEGGNWGYEGVNVYWFNENVFVSFTYSTGGLITKEEVINLLTDKISTSLSNIQSNRFHNVRPVDFEDLSLDFGELDVSDALLLCPSNEKKEYSSSISCKVEPVVCPEYGYQNKICVKYDGDGQPQISTERMYCSPGICSGCYVPRILGYDNDIENVCVPYGTRLGQSKDVEPVIYYEGEETHGNDIISVTIYDEYSAHLNRNDDGKETVDMDIYEEESYSINIGNDEFVDFSVGKIVPAESGDRGYIEITEIKNFNAYCNYDGNIFEQKTGESECQNNYECDSNLCSSGTCVPVKEIIAESKKFSDVIIKMICRISTPFTSESYGECVMNALSGVVKVDDEKTCDEKSLSINDIRNNNGRLALSYSGVNLDPNDVSISLAVSTGSGGGGINCVIVSEETICAGAGGGSPDGSSFSSFSCDAVTECHYPNSSSNYTYTANVKSIECDDVIASEQIIFDQEGCQDTDGRDYYVRGLSQAEGNQAIEICTFEGGQPTTGEEGDSVVETYCENGERKTETYRCPYGCYEGRCINSSNNSGSGGGGGGNEVPSAPTGFVANVPLRTRIDLKWNDSSNEQGYNLFRSTDNWRWTYLANIPQNVVSYSDTALSISVRDYYYRLNAYNFAGVSANSSVNATTNI